MQAVCDSLTNLIESLNLIACNWAWGHKTLKDGKIWEIVHWLYNQNFGFTNFINSNLGKYHSPQEQVAVINP